MSKSSQNSNPFGFESEIPEISNLTSEANGNKTPCKKKLCHICKEPEFKEKTEEHSKLSSAEKQRNEGNLNKDKKKQTKNESQHNQNQHAHIPNSNQLAQNNNNNNTENKEKQDYEHDSSFIFPCECGYVCHRNCLTNYVLTNRIIQCEVCNSPYAVAPVLAPKFKCTNNSLFWNVLKFFAFIFLFTIAFVLILILAKNTQFQDKSNAWELIIIFLAIIILIIIYGYSAYKVYDYCFKKRIARVEFFCTQKEIAKHTENPQEILEAYYKQLNEEEAKVVENAMEIEGTKNLKIPDQSRRLARKLQQITDFNQFKEFNEWKEFNLLQQNKLKIQKLSTNENKKHGVKLEKIFECPGENSTPIKRVCTAQTFNTPNTDKKEEEKREVRIDLLDSNKFENSRKNYNYEYDSSNPLNHAQIFSFRKNSKNNRKRTSSSQRSLLFNTASEIEKQKKVHSDKDLQNNSGFSNSNSNEIELESESRHNYSLSLSRFSKSFQSDLHQLDLSPENQQNQFNKLQKFQGEMLKSIDNQHQKDKEKPQKLEKPLKLPTPTKGKSKSPENTKVNLNNKYKKQNKECSPSPAKLPNTKNENTKDKDMKHKLKDVIALKNCLQNENKEADAATKEKPSKTKHETKSHSKGRSKSKGGKNHIKNYQNLCMRHNHEKSDSYEE